MTTTTSAAPGRGSTPFLAAVDAGETRRSVLEPLLRAELDAFERQYHPANRNWDHYDLDAPAADVGQLAVLAAVLGDRALWHRLVEHRMSADYCHMKLQKWSGVPEEDLGPFPSLPRSARSVRYFAGRALPSALACRARVEAALDGWQAELDADARAAEEQKRQGQRLREPPSSLRTWTPRAHPDLVAEYDRLHAELRRRAARTEEGRELLALGIVPRMLGEYPDLDQAIERLDDEVDRREGRRKPDLRVKVGDRVFGNGKRWTVTSVNERTGVVHLEWREGTSMVGLPVDGDGLEPER
jgi:hypothetical protein